MSETTQSLIGKLTRASREALILAADQEFDSDPTIAKLCSREAFINQHLRDAKLVLLRDDEIRNMSLRVGG